VLAALNERAEHLMLTSLPPWLLVVPVLLRGHPADRMGMSTCR
jgi:hypothetical protein